MLLAHERAPEGFADIHDVIPADELAEIAAGYKRAAGFHPEALNARPSLTPHAGRRAMSRRRRRALDPARLAAVISPLRRDLLAGARAAEHLPDIPDAQIEVIRALPRGVVVVSRRTRRAARAEPVDGQQPAHRDGERRSHRAATAPTTTGAGSRCSPPPGRSSCSSGSTTPARASSPKPQHPSHRADRAALAAAVPRSGKADRGARRRAIRRAMSAAPIPSLEHAFDVVVALGRLEDHGTTHRRPRRLRRTPGHLSRVTPVLTRPRGSRAAGSHASSRRSGRPRPRFRSPNASGSTTTTRSNSSPFASSGVRERTRDVAAKAGSPITHAMPSACSSSQPSTIASQLATPSRARRGCRCCGRMSGTFASGIAARMTRLGLRHDLLRRAVVDGQRRRASTRSSRSASSRSCHDSVKPCRAWARSPTIVKLRDGQRSSSICHSASVSSCASSTTMWANGPASASGRRSGGRPRRPACSGSPGRAAST